MSRGVDFKRIVSLARPELKPLAIGSVALIIGAAMNLLYPLVVQHIVDEITGGMPLGDEIPSDDDVAEAIGFFCSDRSRMVTGETLQVHAGENLR